MHTLRASLSYLRASLVLAMGLAAPAHAQDAPPTGCPDAAETTLRAALSASTDTKVASRGELRQITCASLPHGSKGHVVALANFAESKEWATGDVIETYTVVLAELGQNGTRLHRQLVGQIESDAILAYGADSFQLETQWHDVPLGGGAIGVTSSSFLPGSSAADSRSSDWFAIFVPDGEGYRQVLAIARYRQESIEGCVSVWCRGSRWTNTATTLTPGERGPDGWRHIDMRLEADEFAVEPAVAQSEPTITTATLVYTNGNYQLPDGSVAPGSDVVLLPW